MQCHYARWEDTMELVSYLFTSGSHKIVDIVTEYRHRKEQTKKSITSIRDDFLQRCLAMYVTKIVTIFHYLIEEHKL